MMRMLRSLRAQLISYWPERRMVATWPNWSNLLVLHPFKAFTQPRLQSPCSRAKLGQLHQVLQWTYYDFMLVENDIYADMDASHQPSLASLDQLKRVIYLGNFSKTVGANLRVGYLLWRIRIWLSSSSNCNDLRPDG